MSTPQPTWPLCPGDTSAFRRRSPLAASAFQRWSILFRRWLGLATRLQCLGNAVAAFAQQGSGGGGFAPKAGRRAGRLSRRRSRSPARAGFAGAPQHREEAWRAGGEYGCLRCARRRQSTRPRPNPAGPHGSRTCPGGWSENAAGQTRAGQGQEAAAVLGAGLILGEVNA